MIKSPIDVRKLKIYIDEELVNKRKGIVVFVGAFLADEERFNLIADNFSSIKDISTPIDLNQGFVRLEMQSPIFREGYGLYDLIMCTLQDGSFAIRLAVLKQSLTDPLMDKYRQEVEPLKTGEISCEAFLDLKIL